MSSLGELWDLPSCYIALHELLTPERSTFKHGDPGAGTLEVSWGGAGILRGVLEFFPRTLITFEEVVICYLLRT